MKYILDSSGYVESASCNPISCDDKVSKEYTGSIPSGYDSLDDWILNANIRAYKITSGNLVYDSARDAALQAEWEQLDGYGAVVGKASSNLYDKNKAPVINGYSSTTTIISGGTGRLTYIPCKPNTTYTIQKTASTRFIVSCSASVPAINGAVTRLVNAHPNTVATVTTNSTAKYLILDYYDSDADEQSIKDSIKIELGFVATEYEEYYPPIIAAVDCNGAIHETTIGVEKTTLKSYNANITDVDMNEVVKTGNVVTVAFRGYVNAEIANSSILLVLPFKSTHQMTPLTFKGTRYAPSTPVFTWNGGNSFNLATGPITAGSWIHVYFTYITTD